MIHTIYIEDEIRNHPRTREILGRYPKAQLVSCARYGEVFNPRSQNFRIQKAKPALILARKFDHHVLAAPPGYGLGGERNFYFSHMLNCLYDCRYCFLQGMFRSAHYVMFVNYEDFFEAIDRKIAESAETAYFFSGYDCDSLAFDSVTQFIQEVVPFFASRPNAYLELRTKSTQISSLLKHKPIPNIVVAFSFTPEAVSKQYEHKVPPVAKRLEAMKQLERAGWLLGLRFDPVIDHPNFKSSYERLFRSVFKEINAVLLHSVSLGPFRLPKPIHENMYRLYPDERLLIASLRESNGMISYKVSVEHEMISFCQEELLSYIPESIYFPCLENSCIQKPVAQATS